MNEITLFTKKYKHYKLYYIEQLLDNEILIAEKTINEDNKYYIKNIELYLNKIKTDANNIKFFQSNINKLTRLYTSNIQKILKKKRLITKYRELIANKLYTTLEKENSLYFINDIIDYNITKYPINSITKFKTIFHALLDEYINILYSIDISSQITDNLHNKIISPLLK